MSLNKRPLRDELLAFFHHHLQSSERDLKEVFVPQNIQLQESFVLLEGLHRLVLPRKIRKYEKSRDFRRCFSRSKLIRSRRLSCERSRFYSWKQASLVFNLCRGCVPKGMSYSVRRINRKIWCHGRWDLAKEFIMRKRISDCSTYFPFWIISDFSQNVMGLFKQSFL